MENTLCVAKVLHDEYLSRFHDQMDEMKMHKLMYFAQRESLMYNKSLLFPDSFLGWKYGPILTCVRSQYVQDPNFSSVDGTVSELTKELLCKVLDMYGSMSSWKLSSLSHGEFSWKLSRKGLDSSDNGNRKLTLESMKVDAARELSERNSM